MLDGEPHVRVRAQNAKNRRTQSVPLVPWVVAALKEMRRRNRQKDGCIALDSDRAAVADRDAVFVVNRGLLEALRKDARYAGLGDYDAQGRRTTFHGFRASTCTMLHLAGVAVAVAVLIMRHADPELTLRTLRELDQLADRHRELGKMAVPKVTAVPLAVPLAVEQRPRLAVGGSACPTDIRVASSEVASAQSNRPELAERGPECPDAELVGVAGVEPATLSLSS